MPHQPDRRAWLGATAAGTVATSAMAGGTPTASSAIAAENRKPGTLDWQLTYARFDSGAKYRSSLIEGYATKTSVRPGQSVGFCLSVQKPGPVHIDIYRMGHYQGLGGRHMARLGPFEAKPQATPPVADMRLPSLACGRAAITSIQLNTNHSTSASAIAPYRTRATQRRALSADNCVCRLASFCDMEIQFTQRDRQIKDRLFAN